MVGLIKFVDKLGSVNYVETGDRPSCPEKNVASSAEDILSPTESCAFFLVSRCRRFLRDVHPVHLMLHLLTMRVDHFLRKETESISKFMDM